VTRNLLAEIMLSALDDRVSAAALQCLATYCRTIAHAPQPMPIARFLHLAPAEEHEAVTAKLIANPLLEWDLRDGSGQVTLSTTFSSEWREIVDRLICFGATLNEWSPHEGTPQSLALQKGALLFNRHLFFEVHEVLEAQWVQESGETKLFFQGLIQIAVAFYHRQNQNLRGTLALLQDGLEKITLHQPVFLGIELQEFVSQLEHCRAKLLRLGEEKCMQFREEMIPRLQLVNG
jgi:uncharacterized protein